MCTGPLHTFAPYLPRAGETMASGGNSGEMILWKAVDPCGQKAVAALGTEGRERCCCCCCCCVHAMRVQEGRTLCE